MRQLENVSETLVSSYFSSREVLTDKFSSDLSSENPYWDTGHTVPPLSDICIKVRPGPGPGARCYSAMNECFVSRSWCGVSPGSRWCPPGCGATTSSGSWASSACPSP